MITISVSGATQAELLAQLNEIAELISVDNMNTLSTQHSVDLTASKAVDAVVKVAESKTVEHKATAKAKAKATATVEPSDVLVEEAKPVEAEPATENLDKIKAELQTIAREKGSAVGPANVKQVILDTTGFMNINLVDTKEKLDVLKLALEKL